MTSRKDEWAVRGTDRHRRVVTKFVWVWHPLLVSSPVVSPSSLVGETAGQGIYDNGDPFGGPVFRQVKKVPRKPPSAFAVFQVPRAQNNHY